jgi:hypothetical protein
MAEWWISTTLETLERERSAPDGAAAPSSATLLTVLARRSMVCHSNSTDLVDLAELIPPMADRNGVSVGVTENSSPW